MENVNRIEVIDETGRIFVLYLKENQEIKVSMQDAGKTAKLFIQEKKSENATYETNLTLDGEKVTCKIKNKTRKGVETKDKFFIHFFVGVSKHLYKRVVVRNTEMKIIENQINFEKSLNKVWEKVKIG